MSAASEAVNDQVERVIHAAEENAGRVTAVLSDQNLVAASVERVAAQAQTLAAAGETLREVLGRFSILESDGE